VRTLPPASLRMPNVTLRPARTGDAALFARLYRLARPGLSHLDGEAMQFVVEAAGSAIGAVMLDVGPSEMRVVFFVLLPEARNQGYGAEVLTGLQQAAWHARAPLASVVEYDNPGARRLYLRLGFQPAQRGVRADKLVWMPTGDQTLN